MDRFILATMSYLYVLMAGPSSKCDISSLRTKNPRYDTPSKCNAAKHMTYAPGTVPAQYLPPPFLLQTPPEAREYERPNLIARALRLLRTRTQSLGARKSVKTLSV